MTWWGVGVTSPVALLLDPGAPPSQLVSLREEAIAGDAWPLTCAGNEDYITRYMCGNDLRNGMRGLVSSPVSASYVTPVTKSYLNSYSEYKVHKFISRKEVAERFHY